MTENEEENIQISYPTLEEKIKMKAGKGMIQYVKFKNYLQKHKVLPNELTVEEQKMEDIRNRSQKKKFSIRKNIFRRFDEWLDKKAQEAIEETEKNNPFIQAGLGSGKVDFWKGFTGQRQSRYSSGSSAGAFVRGTLNFLEGILETPFMLEDPKTFMEELINTPKALGQLKEEIKSGNQNIMNIAATQATWGFAATMLGAAKKSSFSVERSGVSGVDDTAMLAERISTEGIGNDALELTEYMNRYNPKGACFMAGTLVATKTGKKAIEKIEEGEEVWCEEENTGEWKIKRVRNHIEKTSDILYHIHIGKQEIQATEEHPIWLEEKGWKKAEDIHIGDKVRCRNGESEEITNIWMEKLPEQVKVYNLSVEDCHNYYVTEKEVLVHNICSKGNRVNIESVIESGSSSPKNKTTLWGQEKYVTEKGLNTVKQHLSGDLADEFNDAMINRLENAYKNNIKISGADLDFYAHEIYESNMMKNGMSYDNAHEAAKAYYNAMEFNFYHTEVIKQNPKVFNNAWFEFWGIERN